jgi:hypothetical protein
VLTGTVTALESLYGPNSLLWQKLRSSTIANGTDTTGEPPPTKQFSMVEARSARKATVAAATTKPTTTAEALGELCRAILAMNSNNDMLEETTQTMKGFWEKDKRFTLMACADGDWKTLIGLEVGLNVGVRRH